MSDKYSALRNLIESLKGPQLVAQFQQYCGIQRLPFNVSKGSSFQNAEKATTCCSYDSDGLKDSNRRTSSSSYANLRKRTNCSSVADNGSDNGDSSATEAEKELACSYVIKNRFWYYLFSFGAGLGYELFYASFFPIWFWNIDGAVGRRMVLLWVIVMYIGQALKDVIKWPRPSSPPVVVLEPQYAMEYGMPSTHAMVGFALPFSMLVFTYHRYDYPIWAGALLAFCWCLLVCFSRLYMGMHSVLDIIAGLLLSATLMIILLPLVDAADQFHLKFRYSPLVTIPVICAMAKLYPKLERWSPARGDTCVIMGAGAGILLGSWLNYQLGIIRGPGLPPPFPVIWPGFNVVGLALLRVTIGIICIIAVRAIGKVLSFSLVCYIHKLNPEDPQTRIRSSVEVPCNIISYMVMGVSITYLSPAVFRFLNIERITMFTEV